jgi:hypothetical protein
VVDVRPDGILQDRQDDAGRARLPPGPQILVEHGDASADPGGDASPVPLRRLQPKSADLPSSPNLKITSAFDPAPAQLLSKPAAAAVQDVARPVGDTESGAGMKIG